MRAWLTCKMNEETKTFYYLNEEKVLYMIELGISPDKVTLTDFRNVFNESSYYKFFVNSVDEELG